EHTADLTQEAFHSAQGGRLNGQPYACGKDGADEVILVLNRCHPIAEQWALDPEGKMRFIRYIQLDGHPSYAVGHGEKLWVACGHTGLHVVQG
nr:hypothetical protein [Clostridia bacterium]